MSVDAEKTREMTQEEAWALLDKQTQKRLNMSALDFFHAYMDGTLPVDPDEVVDLLVLLDLVSLARPKA